MASDVIDDRRCRLPWDYGAIQETFSLAAWLLIPLPEVCKLRKPVLIMEAGPFSIFLAGMRTLAQVYEDHAAWKIFKRSTFSDRGGGGLVLKLNKHLV